MRGRFPPPPSPFEAGVCNKWMMLLGLSSVLHELHWMDLTGFGLHHFWTRSISWPKLIKVMRDTTYAWVELLLQQPVTNAHELEAPLTITFPSNQKRWITNDWIVNISIIWWLKELKNAALHNLCPTKLNAAHQSVAEACQRFDNLHWFCSARQAAQTRRFTELLLVYVRLVASCTGVLDLKENQRQDSFSDSGWHLSSTLLCWEETCD